MAENEHPLTEEHLTRINEGIEKADSALRQVTLAKMAGIEMGAIEQEAKDARDKLLRIKQVYFPGR